MSVISINNLSKSFGGKKILESVNLSIENKEIIGLVGSSGCGKSVFIKILIGFLKPDRGRVNFDLDSADSIGFSMQDNSLYENLTLKQNLNYFSRIYNIPKKLEGDKIFELINKLGLKEFENTLVKNLSGGTKKRADIACALIKDPQILLFDEPFLGLDPFLVNYLSNLILNLNKVGKTILISSHRTEELSKICSRIILLKKGDLVSIKKSQLGRIYN